MNRTPAKAAKMYMPLNAARVLIGLLLGKAPSVSPTFLYDEPKRAEFPAAGRFLEEPRNTRTTPKNGKEENANLR
jgi:hypothetical protein